MLCNSSTTLRGVNENINNSYKNDLALSFNVMVSLSLKKFFDEWLKKTKAEGERERDREELWPLGNIFSLEK